MGRIVEFAGWIMMASGGVLVAVVLTGNSRESALAIVGLVIGGIGKILHGVGKSLAARSAEDLLAEDRRAPVLLLRSFDDDKVFSKFESETQRLKLQFSFNTYISEIYSSFEEKLAAALSVVGPVIAIGRPGELLPPTGAARTWVSHARWQERVKADMGECGLAVMIMGSIKGEEGLSWELTNLLDRLPPEKILFVMPPVKDEEARARWQSFQERSRGMLPPFQGCELAAGFNVAGECTVVREPRIGRAPGEQYASAVMSLVQPRQVQKLVVSYSPLRVFPASTRLLFMAMIALPWLYFLHSALRGSFEPEPERQGLHAEQFTLPDALFDEDAEASKALAKAKLTANSATVANTDLKPSASATSGKSLLLPLLGITLWTALCGLILYVSRDKRLVISPEGVSYSRLWGSRQFAWSQIRDIEELNFRVEVAPGKFERHRIPRRFSESCPSRLISGVLSKRG